MSQLKEQKVQTYRNRYISLDEGKLKAHSVRLLPKSIESKQLFNKNTLLIYITHICKYIKELMKFKNEGYIRHTLLKIFNTTSNFQDIQDIFAIPIQQMTKDILLNRCLQFTSSLNLRINQQQMVIQHFMKWFAYFEELLYIEMQKINEHYLHGIQSKIQNQLLLNQKKEQELRHSIKPRKQDIATYIKSLQTYKPNHLQFSSVNQLEKYENKLGGFELISTYSRNQAKQLDKIQQDLNGYLI